MENKLTNVSFPNRKGNFKIKKTGKLLFLFCTIVFGLLPSTVLSQTANIKIDQDKTASVDEVFNLIMSQKKRKKRKQESSGQPEDAECYKSRRVGRRSGPLCARGIRRALSWLSFYAVSSENRYSFTIV